MGGYEAVEGGRLSKGDGREVNYNISRCQFFYQEPYDVSSNLWTSYLMKKAGRHIDIALIRGSLNEKAKTLQLRRLQRDLEEIQNEKIPTVGVTARPLQNDMFTWHANIRGPEKTLYEGGVFHLELKFPQSYPSHPPSIRIFNNIPHPNVFGGYICLDILQQNGVEEGCGWTSAYSVQSVLTQLQSFLFEENLSADKAKVEMEVKKAVKEANSFKCPSCKHGGKLSLWPAFSSKEASLEEFETIEEENELIRKELVCFHTKLTYQQNQLGLGLNISKIPRTGLIKEGETYFDYISLKAFIKEARNLTSSNEKITHWLPVYFGKGDNEERFLHLLTRACSMIMTNSTKNFRPELILEVFPKLLVNLVFQIMNEKKHASIRIIRILTHVHSMFLYALRRFPELTPKLNATLANFLQSEENRHKNSVPNLGCILAYLCVSDAYSFGDLVEAYFLEQLDRQVFWIMKSVPELVSDALEETADRSRAAKVFETQITGFHMLCFYKLFLTKVAGKRESTAQMLQDYEENLCKLPNQEEDHFQAEIFRIAKDVKSFGDYFKYLGLEERADAEVVKLLKQAIKNSERKEYHSRLDVLKLEEEIRRLSSDRKRSTSKVDLTPKLPSSEEQFRKLYANMPAYSRFIKVAASKEEQGNFSFDYKEEISKEEDWREMCLQRWSWVKEALLADPGLSSSTVSLKALEHTKKGVSKTEDRATRIIKDDYKNSHIKYEEPHVGVPEMDWKRLFLRLDLEDFLKYIDMNPDFATFYQKLAVCARNNINTLLVPLVEVSHIKSGYYYVTAILSQLTTLKYLEFSGLPQLNNKMNAKAAKAIRKGLSNFHEAKGRLDILSFNNIIVGEDFSESLFSYLSATDSLRSLRFSKTNILAQGNAMKVLSNLLINIKDLEEIELSKCSLDQEKCKILADALMRMKKLKIFRMNMQKGLGQGLASIVYNLAFNPNLVLLDLGEITIEASRGAVANINETVVSLYKMLKISASIEILKLNKVPCLNNALTREFWVALGECKSLRVLDLSNSGDLSSKIRDLGSSVAFNAKKKGCLSFLNLTGTLNNQATFNNLYWGMCVSEYDEEQWYGDPNKLAKMIAGNYTKVYYNNLRALQLDACTNLNPAFVLSHHNKLLNKKDPEYVKILADSPHLTTLHLQSTGLQKNMADILVLALDDRREKLKCQLKVLDLSKNNLDKEGAKILASVLPFNQVIEVLDLSKNCMGVSGADELAKSLRNNKSLKFLNVFNNKIGYDGAKSIAENIVRFHPNLEFLEVGHNRIRDKGLEAIVTNLIANTSSKLRVLGARFNFLTNEGLLESVGRLAEGKSGLEELFIRNNLANDEGIYKLKDLQQAQGLRVAIDLLERVKYLDQEKTDRTIWIHPISKINIGSLKKFFENDKKCGIILDFRVRNGRAYPNKRGENKFCFVEFADPASVTEALAIASRQEAVIAGNKFRIYKAGTGTFLYTKKSAKQKKLEDAKNSLPHLPFPVIVPTTMPLGAPVAVPGMWPTGMANVPRPGAAGNLENW